MRSLILPLLAAAASLVAAPAAADTTAVEIRISHADLDLTKAEDVARMKQRIGRAVVKACMREVSLPRPGRSVDEACVAQVKAKALAELDRRRIQQVAALP